MRLPLGIAESSSGLPTLDFEDAGSMHVECVVPVKVSDFEPWRYSIVNRLAPSVSISLPETCGAPRECEGDGVFCANTASVIRASSSAQAKSREWAFKAHL